jgi:carbon starvation protein
MTAMPIMLGVLCILAIAYRYYSAFIAARVATLDDTRRTPAVEFKDGHNFHPTSKWVLFGHHFAAISGAGPLIGPVLAAQFGYLPGLLWIVIGVCLGGAVQDFIVLCASIRRGGSSLAQMAYSEIGKTAGTAGTTAILFIVIVALAGLGSVVVKALGGETVKYPAGSMIQVPVKELVPTVAPDGSFIYRIPNGSKLYWGTKYERSMEFQDGFEFKTKQKLSENVVPLAMLLLYRNDRELVEPWSNSNSMWIQLPPDAVRLVPGSYWGTFTIACTIPIALLVGLYMYKLRPGKVVEASIIGGVLTLGATFLGGMIHPDSSLAHAFNLSTLHVTWAMAIYGFIASVLPVWVLLCPRDYLSSFLKIGTIALLVIGTLIANPKMQAPAYNTIFAHGGPTLGATAHIFPFLFITIMCGAISGFHALVSSGTTPKMIKKETDARMIGYGAMLMEGLVGVVAMIAATTLPTNDYYAMNTPLAAVPAWQDKILQVGGAHGPQDVAAAKDNLPLYEKRTQESLRGRTGGAVTLAVGFAHIFDQMFAKFRLSPAALESMWKYWYHFAIMFEALFILTTIDTGTRIGRFLLQEVAGKIHPSMGLQGNVLASIVCTALVVAGWAWFMNSDSFDVIWKTFGIANQTLAVIALGVASAWLVKEGKRKYLWVTVLPLLFVIATTGTAGAEMMAGYIRTIRTQWPIGGESAHKLILNSLIQGGLVIGMLTCAIIVLAGAAWRATSPASERRGFEILSRGG